MRSIVLFAIFAVVSAVDYYKVKDDIDIDELAAHPGGLEAYMDCFLDKGPCSEIAASYKQIIKETTEQACARCTDKLKHQYWHFLDGIKKKMTETYKEYRQRYDPENKYFDALEKELSKYA